MKNHDTASLLKELSRNRYRGSNCDEYNIYLACADDGKGNDFVTGEPLKTYEEWLTE